MKTRVRRFPAVSAGFSHNDYDGDLTAAELQDILGSLDEDQIRALFWRGHGGIYTEKNGEVVAAWYWMKK